MLVYVNVFFSFCSYLILNNYKLYVAINYAFIYSSVYCAVLHVAYMTVAKYILPMCESAVEKQNRRKN